MVRVLAAAYDVARMQGRAPRKAPTNAGLGLTAREIDVLRLIAHGYTYAGAAKSLGISTHTVGSHIKKTYRKLGVHTAGAAVMRAAQLGIIDRGSGQYLGFETPRK